MQKQQGFTLIELVVVIIILGILAVVAAPKFINLQSDARYSTLQGLQASLQGANSLVYSKAAIAGSDKQSSATTVNLDASTAVSTVYGYLDATEANFAKALEISAQTTDTDVTTGNASSTGDWLIYSDDSTVKFWQNGAPAACALTYTPATSSSLPQYALPANGSNDC
ncbi:MSHA biogenesis protein MshA [Shewanella mangrovi]|uniref:MSHA biogenesis protein MshA n=1 Tax=Shewanella mangrovi TaxID=1515746 RepID=A0A094JF41_9GAMM|nr:type II secretion system protein [Shewanella mangrovi]KFZ37822.1 MSHA biogenesis protein MshA [Shewanella mangrovi]